MASALVTGAASGLGAAIARRLTADGYRVAIVDRDGDAARAHAKALPRASSFGADVTDAAAIEAVLDAFGEIPDVLVNNAGIVRFGPLLEHSVDDFRKVLDVNLTGTFIVTQAVAKRMVSRGSGSIVNVTSLNAVAPSPDAGAYPASKAAIALLTQQFALALGPHGIRVNAVAPGFIDAGMSALPHARQRPRGSGGSLGSDVSAVSCALNMLIDREGADILQRRPEKQGARIAASPGSCVANIEQMSPMQCFRSPGRRICRSPGLGYLSLRDPATQDYPPTIGLDTVEPRKPSRPAARTLEPTSTRKGSEQGRH